jgi:hypothetical protein
MAKKAGTKKTNLARQNVAQKNKDLATRTPQQRE